MRQGRAARAHGAATAVEHPARDSAQSGKPPGRVASTTAAEQALKNIPLSPLLALAWLSDLTTLLKALPTPWPLWGMTFGRALQGVADAQHPGRPHW